VTKKPSAFEQIRGTIRRRPYFIVILAILLMRVLSLFPLTAALKIEEVFYKYGRGLKRLIKKYNINMRGVKR
jgi:uncharacterized membrane protein YhaH (DUF805 family)